MDSRSRTYTACRLHTTAVGVLAWSSHARVNDCLSPRARHHRRRLPNHLVSRGTGKQQNNGADGRGARTKRSEHKPQGATPRQARRQE